jgi:hypothetical protein
MPLPTAASLHPSHVELSLGPEQSASSISSSGSVHSMGSSRSAASLAPLPSAARSHHTTTTDDVAADSDCQLHVADGGTSHLPAGGMPSSAKLAAQPCTPSHSSKGHMAAPLTISLQAQGDAQHSLEAASPASPTGVHCACGIFSPLASKKKRGQLQQQQQAVEGALLRCAETVVPPHTGTQLGEQQQGAGADLLLPKVAPTSLERRSALDALIKGSRPDAPSSDAPADDAKREAVEAAAAASAPAPAPAPEAASAAAPATPRVATAGAGGGQRQQRPRKGFGWLPWSKKGRTTAAAGGAAGVLER